MSEAKHGPDAGLQAVQALPSSADNAPPDLRADVLDGLMSRLEAFGDEFGRLAQTTEQKALAEAFGVLVAEVHSSIVSIAEATRQHGPAGSTPEEMDKLYREAGVSDERLTDVDLNKLYAEWEMDRAARVWQDATGIPYEPGQFEKMAAASTDSLESPGETRRLPTPTQIIANPRAYLPREQQEQPAIERSLSASEIAKIEKAAEAGRKAAGSTVRHVDDERSSQLSPPHTPGHTVRER